MQRFIVEIIDAQGRRQWVFMNGRTSADVRKQVEESGKGFTVNQAVFDTDPTVQDLLTMHEGPTEFTIRNFEDVQRIPATGQRRDSDTVSKFDPTPEEIRELLGKPAPDLVAPDDPTYSFQQFLSGLRRRGAGTSGVAGRARVDRFAPTQARFLADQALNPLSEGLAGSFADYTARQPLHGREAYRSASDLFDQAVRIGAGLNPTGAGFGSLSEMQQGFLNPTTEAEARHLENLARAKARGQYGVATEFFRPNVNLREQFFAQEAPSALSFSDFLNQKIFGQRPRSPLATGQTSLEHAALSNANPPQIDVSQIGTPVPGFSEDTRQQFEDYWPGM